MLSRDKKTIKLDLAGTIEKYEELVTVELSRERGKPVTVTALKAFGDANCFLFLKGTIGSLKHLFMAKEKELASLHSIEKNCQKNGVFPVLYIRRVLSRVEGNVLINTINEGTHHVHIENSKLENLLMSFAQTQIEILGVLGVQKELQLRNRIIIEDFIHHGITPWIVSNEDEDVHMTSLNSIKIFSRCESPLVIDGHKERIVIS